MKPRRYILARAVGIRQFALILAFAGTVLADDYTQHSAASIGDMTSATVKAAPSGAPATRTTIGIGEQVVCSIDPTTWSDCDFNTTTQTVETDELGNRIWVSCHGSTVSPNGVTQENSTTMTADMAPNPGNLVQVTVYDSMDRFLDEGVTRTIAFEIIAPTSHTYAKQSDNPPWTAWSSGTKYLGARTYYGVTVNPTNVCFSNAEFRVSYGTPASDTWPDGSGWTGPSGNHPWLVNDLNQWTVPDKQRTGRYSSNKLYTGTKWQDFAPTFSMPMQYKNQSGTWVHYWSAPAGRNYYHANRTSAVTVGGQAGGSQGPWQAP
jgi:hypothetical protein